MNTHMIRGAIFAFLEYELNINELMYFNIDRVGKRVIIEYFDNASGWPQEVAVSYDKLDEIMGKQIDRSRLAGDEEKVELVEGYREYWQAFTKEFQ